jgi:hypothetical protein
MGVVVSLPLFGNPGRELEEGAPLRGQQLRELATSLTERLARAADVVDRLVDSGWSARTALFDVLLYHPRVGTAEEAVRGMRDLGIDPEAFIIMEDVDEDDPAA